MSNITIIIPVHELNENVQKFLEKSIESVMKQKNANIPDILIVSPESISDELVQLFGDNEQHVSFLVNDGKIDYQSQVNAGVNFINTKFFSVLEFDDTISDSYIKNGELYIKSYPEIDIFLTMMIEVNDNDEGIKLTNETVWAQQFVGENGEMGNLNTNALKQYTDFKLSGALINTDEFKNLGGYKSNIKLTFMYEFLLRALNNASKIYSIPKIGYKHLATREDSLFNGYLKTMDVNERRFWFETASKESNFMNDRPIDLTKIQKIVVEE